MKDTTRELLNTAIADACAATSVASSAYAQKLPEYKEKAKASYDALFQYIEYLEANQRQPSPPDFYRQDQEAVEQEDLLAGGVRYK